MAVMSEKIAKDLDVSVSTVAIAGGVFILLVSVLLIALYFMVRRLYKSIKVEVEVSQRLSSSKASKAV